MTVIDAVQLIALKSVEKPDGNYFVRRVCRWYSREFSTPLHQVEELPVDYVLQHYFESMYEDMEEDERKQRIKELLEPAHKRKERILQEELEQMEMEEFARFTEEQAKLESKEQANDGLNVSIQSPAAPMPIQEMPEAELTSNRPAQSSLPEIRMEFADLNLLDEDIDSIPVPPKGK